MVGPRNVSYCSAMAQWEILNLYRFLIQKGPKAPAAEYMRQSRRSCECESKPSISEGQQKRMLDRDV